MVDCRHDGTAVVIEVFPHSDTLAAIMFAAPTLPLFLFPAHLLKPTRRDYLVYTKSQITKRTAHPNIGEFYQYTLPPEDFEGRRDIIIAYDRANKDTSGTCTSSQSAILVCNMLLFN